MSFRQQAHWILGDPQSRRVSDYRETALQFGLPAPRCIDWIDVIKEGADLLNCISVDSRLRIDSFGQRTDVIAALISHGDGLEFPQVGQILSLDHQYSGLSRILRVLNDWSISRPDVELDQQPSEIEVMFDKWATHRRFATHGELRSHRPQTTLLPIEPSAFWDSLQPFVQSCGGRVFVKPRYASSASGVCYFRVCNGRQQLIAPIEIDRNLGRVRLFNSLLVRSYTSPRDIQDIFSVLAPQGMIAEAAVNKARVDGDRFDFRVVVINGKADHVVARQSTSPITNLHLGNARASLHRVEEAVGADRVQDCRQLALRAADLFPGALYCGVDILLPRTGSPLVCEVNAFGDFLPGLIADGRSVYQAILNSSRRCREALF